MKEKRSGKTGIEKEAGCVLIETAGMLMRQGNTIDKVLESLELCFPDEDFEKSVTYQALKTSAEGMQHTLDEMNDVLEKFGFKE